MEDWIERFDKNSNRKFYYNTKSKKSTWTNPNNSEIKEGINKLYITKVDPNSNKTFYYNRLTKVSTWQKPENIDELMPLEENKLSSEKNAIMTSRDSNILSKVDPNVIIKKTQNEEEDQGGEKKSNSTIWLQTTDKNGKIFYYNTVTKKSSWLKPQDAASVIVSADKFVKKDVDTSSVTKGKIGELQLLWVTKIDANSGKTFYYNRKTLKSTWIKPDNLDEMFSNEILDTPLTVEKKVEKVIINADNEEIIDNIVNPLRRESKGEKKISVEKSAQELPTKTSMSTIIDFKMNYSNEITEKMFEDVTNIQIEKEIILEESVHNEAEKPKTEVNVVEGFFSKDAPVSPASIEFGFNPLMINASIEKVKKKKIEVSVDIPKVKEITKEERKPFIEETSTPNTLKIAGTELRNRPVKSYGGTEYEIDFRYNYRFKFKTSLPPPPRFTNMVKQFPSADGDSNKRESAHFSFVMPTPSLKLLRSSSEENTLTSEIALIKYNSGEISKEELDSIIATEMRLSNALSPKSLKNLIPVKSASDIKKLYSPSDNSKNNYAGWLVKKGGGKEILGRHNWKRRYFNLTGNFLSYYNNDKDVLSSDKQLGIIPLLGCQIVEIDNPGHPFYFEIRPPEKELTNSRVFYIKAENKDSLDIWISKLYIAATNSL